MEYLKYQHLERFGTSEVENIHIGKCYIFPKIDGTNASVWFDDGRVMAGSRNRQLSIDKDNAGFYNAMLEDGAINTFFEDHPELRLYGEWLVPHSLKTYREEAWRKFYVFDVMNVDGSYLPFETYAALLSDYDIEVIHPIKIIENPSYESLMKLTEANTFLIEDGKGSGEGIVIKNYEFRNRYGRVTWAKIVRNEFKELHGKTMGAPVGEEKKMTEIEIVEKYLTKEFILKEKAKITDADKLSGKDIPKMLHVGYYEFIKEEAYIFIPKMKNPTINFKTLQHLVFTKIKEVCL